MRENNIIPFSVDDMDQLDTIRETVKRELSTFGEIEGFRLKSVECNLTQRVAGSSTPDQGS